MFSSVLAHQFSGSLAAPSTWCVTEKMAFVLVIEAKFAKNLVNEHDLTTLPRTRHATSATKCVLVPGLR